METRKVTLALTHFNRFELLKEAIAQVLDDARIAEFVIVDDASTDNSYLRILETYASLPRFKVGRNKENQDCYRNKKIAVEAASSEWVILFDSDNIITPKYLDAIFALSEWQINTFYCPSFAEPHFDYTAFSGHTVMASNMALYLDKPKFGAALNTANYFVNRHEWLSVWDGSVDPVTSDSIFQAYNWLRYGGRLYFVPGLHYFHRIHDGSHFKKNVHRTGTFGREVDKKLRALA